jgi:predicted DNA-binding transcriptional regulator YafY
MKLLEQIERINRLNEMIKYRRTGTPQQLAKRLNLSTSMIYKLMDELRLREVPVEYSRQMGTYYYSRGFQMKISIDFKFLAEDESKDFAGGSYLFGFSQIKSQIFSLI